MATPESIFGDGQSFPGDPKDPLISPPPNVAFWPAKR